MSDFSVKVFRITEPVEHHPNADRLSLIRILGFTCISAKLDDGSHRYNVGDLVVYVPEGAVVSEFLLKQGFWNEKTNQGILAGPEGNRVKALRLRGIYSQGILFPVKYGQDHPLSDELVGRVYAYVTVQNEAKDDAGNLIFADGVEHIEVQEGDEVAEAFGITKYVPPIPPELEGEVCSIHGHTTRYDFESIQAVPDLFTVGEEVIVTEKIHGTNCQIGYVPGLNNDELFYDGNVYVSAKGLAAQGIVFKNVPENDGNTYVEALRTLLANGLGDRLKAASKARNNASIRVFGEVYGPGVQKGFNYGQPGHSFAVFDIQVNKDFLPHNEFVWAADDLGVATVPVLYIGPFDLEKLVEFRDGNTTVAKSHIREGIVVKSKNETIHVNHGRKIGKWVSPDYAVKATGDEIN